MISTERDGIVTLEMSHRELYCLRTVAGQLIKGNGMNVGNIDGRRVGGVVRIEVK